MFIPRSLSYVFFYFFILCGNSIVVLDRLSLLSESGLFSLSVSLPFFINPFDRYSPYNCFNFFVSCSFLSFFSPGLRCHTLALSVLCLSPIFGCLFQLFFHPPPPPQAALPLPALPPARSNLLACARWRAACARPFSCISLRSLRAFSSSSVPFGCLSLLSRRGSFCLKAVLLYLLLIVAAVINIIIIINLQSSCFVNCYWYS